MTDSLDYDRHATSLAQTGSFPASQFNASEPTAFRPPLYPLALAAVYKVAGPSHEARRIDAGRGFQALLGTIVVGLIAGLIARALMPGPDPMGWIATIVLGIVGSWVAVGRNEA